MAKRTLVRRADNSARISYDDSTSELIFERYNTETTAWEESLKINLPAKRITLIADVDDDLKINFGRTNKYALRWQIYLQRLFPCCRFSVISLKNEF